MARFEELRTGDESDCGGFEDLHGGRVRGVRCRVQGVLTMSSSLRTEAEGEREIPDT
jgi:hypothetical protein